MKRTLEALDRLERLGHAQRDQGLAAAQQTREALEPDVTRSRELMSELLAIQREHLQFAERAHAIDWEKISRLFRHDGEASRHARIIGRRAEDLIRTLSRIPTCDLAEVAGTVASLTADDVRRGVPERVREIVAQGVPLPATIRKLVQELEGMVEMLGTVATNAGIAPQQLIDIKFPEVAE